METKLDELKKHLIEATDLKNVLALLTWDQQTYMPSGGTSARGRQLALLGQLSQEKLTSDEVGKLLDELKPYEESLPYDSDEASLIRVSRREYERNVKVPPKLTGRIYQNMAETFEAWGAAKEANDFKKVEPYLEKTLDLSLEYANCFPGYENIADPLIDVSDFDVKANDLRTLFSQLREELAPLVKTITELPAPDDSFLHQHYPKEKQIEFGKAVIKNLGYDFNRGREDLAPHPFTTKFSLGDVRITTRVKEDFLTDALFSTIHESGHAMYEQGINMAYEGTPLANGTSGGVHESQSRLWENVVGRSLSFWTYYYPRLQQAFPEQLDQVPLENFYRAVNKVERSLIRTDADEATYDLHVMLRFDLEMAMLEGQLLIRDLPDAWRERFKQDLGIEPPDDRVGVMQDIHWYAGLIGGAFQSYTLGNIMAALFFSAATKAHPEIHDEIAKGQFGTLHRWLIENIYQYGSKYTANELVERITGGPLTIKPYVQYLKSKYGEIYKV